jgi:hypothetical protein
MYLAQVALSGEDDHALREEVALRAHHELIAEQAVGGSGTKPCRELAPNTVVERTKPKMRPNPPFVLCVSLLAVRRCCEEHGRHAELTTQLTQHTRLRCHLNHRRLQKDCITAATSSTSVLSIRICSPLRLLSSMVIAWRGTIGAI